MANRLKTKKNRIAHLDKLRPDWNATIRTVWLRETLRTCFIDGSAIKKFLKPPASRLV